MAQATGSSVSTAEDVQVTGRRVLATLVDAVLFIVLQVVLGLLLGGATAEGGGASVSLSGLPALLFFALIFGYYIFMEGRFGQTVGKMLLGIKVVRESDGNVPGYGGAALRTVLRIVDGFLAYLVGFIVVLVSGKNQRLGDMVAHTLVVRK
ncbi:RDD family protein [Rubrobacter indicoceani]|uniref:RDD family protein n=1 Tax=Rubrobacter indicoceani TaxID=2051957 RepID=UPI000E5ABA5B|nr:RDD family protein [Rubrobacter indicoceani]